MGSGRQIETESRCRHLSNYSKHFTLCNSIFRCCFEKVALVVNGSTTNDRPFFNESRFLQHDSVLETNPYPKIS